MIRSTIPAFRRVVLLAIAVALIAMMPHATATAIAQTEKADPDLLVYHQITDLGDDIPHLKR